MYLPLDFGLLWPEAVGWLFDGMCSRDEWDLVVYLIGMTHIMISLTKYSFVFPEQMGHSLSLCRLGEHAAGLSI